MTYPGSARVVVAIHLARLEAEADLRWARRGHGVVDLDRGIDLLGARELAKRLLERASPSTRQIA